MKQIEFNSNERCCKKVQHSDHFGKTYKSVCGKKATHTNGQHFFCRHHSRTGRFVFRVGDVGEIVARFDIEEELHNNAHLFEGMRMQKISKSSRRDIYPKK